MALTEHQKYHLKKFVKELEVKQARHTEFVSVYVPQEYDLNKVINQLSQEQGTATNIKSAQTRNPQFCPNGTCMSTKPRV